MTRVTRVCINHKWHIYIFYMNIYIYFKELSIMLNIGICYSIVSVVGASNTENIFSRQILFEAIIINIQLKIRQATYSYSASITAGPEIKKLK